MRMKSVVVVGRLMSRRLLSGKEVREGFGSGQTGFFFFPPFFFLGSGMERRMSRILIYFSFLHLITF